MLALLAFLGSTLLLVWLERISLRETGLPALPNWTLDHLAIPLLRVAVVLSLISLAYPRIFGLAEAPALNELLATDQRRAHWINALFLLGLALPLLPAADHLGEAVLPIQGMLALAMLFRWLSEAMGIPDAIWWPSTGTLIFSLIWIGANLLLAQLLQRHATAANGHLLRDALLLLMQLPVLWVFGQQLGSALPAHA